MKKFFRFIKRLIIGILLTAFFVIVILLSTLLLNRNDYGVTQFKDKILIMVDSQMANSKYADGALVIVESKTINEVKPDDEIFVYEKNEDDTVKIVVADIESINMENERSPFVVLKNGGGSWGAKYIAGSTYKVYPKIGKYLNIIESKWVFFAAIIVPCFFILLYEIYLIIITIKFGDYEEDDDSINKETAKEELSGNQKEVTNEVANDATIAELMKQINELKSEIQKNNKEEKTEKDTKEEKDKKE